MARLSDARTCRLCHKALQYAEARMYGRNPSGKYNPRWDIGSPAECSWNKKFNAAWRRFEAERLFDGSMTLAEFVEMSFGLLTKAFKDLDEKTIKAFKSQMWFDDGTQLILAHPPKDVVEKAMALHNI